MTVAAQVVSDLAESNHDLLYIAIIGGAFGLAGVVVSAWTSVINNKRSKSIHATLGTSNGQGTVAVMLERVIGSLGQLDNKFEAHVVEDSKSFDELRVLAGNVKTALDAEATKVRTKLEEREKEVTL